MLFFWCWIVVVALLDFAGDWKGGLHNIEMFNIRGNTIGDVGAKALAQAFQLHHAIRVSVPSQAADVGMSLANSAAKLSDMGATEVGGKPIAEFKSNLLTSFIGVVKTAKVEPPLVNVTLKTKEVKINQQISNALPDSASGLDANYDAANPSNATVTPPQVDAIKRYATYIDTCPSFVHNICHEDMGGSERLRSPCPEHLVCYYCLRINPLYCVE